MTRHHGQDQSASPPPLSALDPQPLSIIEDTARLGEDEMRRIRDAFAAAQGQPARWYPIAPYEVTIPRPYRSWWRRLFNLPARRRDWI